ncbi:CARDB domain-containing protein [Methylomagnum ishizawai]|uniref:CARDB domain-containing protein n=1 Tax=Methylomagnum ishizawai TaxID=1760988 RepID=UPI001C334AF2|nr:CARDB domain-containing protein [Methylomagnum ishizawai]BBL76818.1 hypothetical protein MishRS11D_39160 [Methylomagnum ishizawai]
MRSITPLLYRRAALLLGLCATGSAHAANTLTGAEYFIDPTPWLEPHAAGTSPCDNDPGEGKGIPLPPTDGSWNAITEAVKQTGVDVSKLTPGVHDLCVRFVDSKGQWGPARFTHFTSGRGLAACEYFIDTDPGPGKGQPFPAQDGVFNATQEALKTATLPVTGLALGSHTVGSRCRDEWGRWGETLTTTLNLIHLPAPVVASATPGDGQATLNWAAVAGAASYNIYRGTTAGGESSTPVKTGLTGTSATLTGLVNGTKYFFKMAAVNSAETSPLSNEVSATPTATLPDFVASGLLLYPASPTPDSSFNLRVTITNQGKGSANGGKLAVWTHQPTAQSCNATPDKSVDVGTLAPGASKTLNVNGLAAGVAGAKTLRVFADGNCASAELNEANNQATLSYRVGSAPQPDFVVTKVILSPSLPTAQGSFTATITVKNQGTANGNAGYMDVWANQTTAQTCGAEGDAYASLGTLAAGASKTVTLNLVAGTAGIKSLRAFVDSWCQTNEANEGNNQTSQSYTVK